MKNRGFSLVEVAMAFAIIGVTLGGVMYGLKVKDQAELNSVIADIHKFTRATQTFRAIYGHLPGDISNTQILPRHNQDYVSGNGNGIIEPSEALHFWHHLSGSGIIKGNFNPTQNFTTTINGPGGVPASTIKKFNLNGGFKVTSEEVNSKISFKFSGFDGANNNDLGILKPEEAYYIDTRFDDGNPITGFIKATEGGGSTINSCVTSSDYTLSNGNADCILTISAEEMVNSGVEYEEPGGDRVTCDGSNVGSTRVSSLSFCPVGYVGKIIESCTNSGSWIETRRFCELRKCIDGKVVGQTREVSCPVSQRGSITQKCGLLGVYENIANNCSQSTNDCSNGDSRKLLCAVGQVGVWEQNCVAGNWTDIRKTCAEISCPGGSSIIGETRSQPSFACPTGYRRAASGGTPRQVCTMPITGDVGEWIYSFSPCVPTYQGSCNPSESRNIGCPRTQFGVNEQICNDEGFWEGGLNSCTNTSCGGAPIGSYRVSTTQNCPIGTIGKVFEVCKFADSTMVLANWQISQAGCLPLACSARNNIAASNAEGNAESWPESTPGQSVSANSCMPDFTPQDGNLPERFCGFDGTWQDAINPCIAGCPAGIHAETGTLWQQTVAGTIAVINQCPNLNNLNQCPNGKITPSVIYRTCFEDGTWSDPFGGLNNDGKCIEGNEALCIY